MASENGFVQLFVSNFSRNCLLLQILGSTQFYSENSEFTIRYSNIYNLLTKDTRIKKRKDGYLPFYLAFHRSILAS